MLYVGKSKAALRAVGNRQRRKDKLHVYYLPLGDMLMREVVPLLVADRKLKAESIDDRREV